MPAARTPKEFTKVFALEYLPRDKGATAKSEMTAEGLQKEKKEKIKKVATTKDKRHIYGIARSLKTKWEADVKKHNRYWKGTPPTTGYQKWLYKKEQKDLDDKEKAWKQKWADQQAALKEVAEEK